MGNKENCKKNSNFINMIKSYKWYEFCFYAFGILAVVLLAIFFKSSALTIILSIFGITYVFLVSKKFKFAIIFGIIYTTLYVVQSVLYKNWGEFILNLCVVLPMLIASLVSWLIQNDKKSLVVKSKKISLKEVVIVSVVSVVLSVAFYFVLRYFNTPNLIVATLSLFFTVLGNYLLMRQSPFMFFVYILNNIVVILIWLLPVVMGVGNSAETLPMIVTLSFYLIFNIVGAINWNRKEKQEEIADKQEKIN